jgi:hypothetical protein
MAFALPAALPLIASAIPSVIGAAAGLVGMFRSNYTITEKEFAIGATPLVAAVAEELLASNPVPTVSVDDFSVLGDQIITRFQGALKSRLKLDGLIGGAKGRTVRAADRELDDLRTVLAAAVKALGEAKADLNIQQLRELITEVRTRAIEVETKSATDRARVMLGEAVIARFDTFVTEITTSPKDGGYPPLVRAAIREGLHGQSRKYSHVLFVGIEASGGEMITRQANFAKTGMALIAGGEQVSYLLLEIASNKTVAAGSKTLLGHLNYDLKTGETRNLDRSDFTSPDNGNTPRPGLLRRIVKFVVPNHS